MAAAVKIVRSFIPELPPEEIGNGGATSLTSRNKMHRRCQFQVGKKSRKISNLRLFSPTILETWLCKIYSIGRPRSFRESLLTYLSSGPLGIPVRSERVGARCAGSSDQDNRKRRSENCQRISTRCAPTPPAALFWQRWRRTGSRLPGGGGRWSCGGGGNRRGRNCFDPSGRRRGRRRRHFSVGLGARGLRRSRGRRWNCSCGGGSRSAV